MNGLKTNCVLKSNLDTGHFLYIHPNLMMMLGFVLNFAAERDITVCITSMIRTPEENRAVGAVSRTHIEGRALDVSLRPEFGWREEDVNELQDELERRFADIAAVVWQDDMLIPRPMVVHDAGSGEHLHLQVRPTE